jgi:hypothetical protein
MSSPREFHPEALAEPDLNLSAHPAPAMEPRRALSKPGSAGREADGTDGGSPPIPNANCALVQFALTVGRPSGRAPPPGFGIMTLLTGPRGYPG